MKELEQDLEFSASKSGGPVPNRTLSIGAPVPRIDAYEKVTGKTRFAADYYSENMLWAGVKRAGIPHARLKGIDATIAEKHPGVIRVLTHKDITGSNRQGVIRKDQPVLVNDKVRHCGDAIALVLAEDKESLRQAIDLIKFNFEPLPAVLEVEKALETGAPLVHEDNAEGNVLLKGDLKIGAGEAADKECDVVLEACFETPRQEHAYLETEAGWAQIGDDGKLTIVCSTQTPFRDRMEVADALGLEPTIVRIIVPYVGGAFGGKDGVTVQSFLALAALHSEGRPVKMWWDREESFLAGTKRHAVRMVLSRRSQEGWLPALLECPIVSRHRPLRSSRRSCNGIGPRACRRPLSYSERGFASLVRIHQQSYRRGLQGLRSYSGYRGHRADDGHARG